MGAVYKSICYEADSFLLLATKLAEKEVQLKLEIENLMNEGFVKIAKARYIMGSTCVTKMQLPTENSNPIKALATVCRKEVNNSCIFYIVREDASKSNERFGEASDVEGCYESNGTSKVSLSSTGRSEAAFKHILQTDPKSLKKSKKAFLVENHLYQQYNDELLDEMSNSDSKESLVSVTDPIRLFGILVPNALKVAQVIFNDVVNLLGECATVQFQLNETLEKYNHLARVKCLIEAAAKETKLDILTPKIYWTPVSSTTVCTPLSGPVPTEVVEELEMAGEQEGSLISGISDISIQKTVRSVFYDEKEPAEEGFSVWSAKDIEMDSKDND